MTIRLAQPAIPSSIQPGWHIPGFGTTEFRDSLSRWTHDYIRRRPLPRRVLDLSQLGFPSPGLQDDICLVEPKEKSGVDVPLSHCWVGRQVMKTTKASYRDHLRRISFEALSQTFQEAILVCRSLQVRYLWIDSLCIIQDDSGDWKEQAALMAQIYEDASFCIAAHGTEDGLLPTPKKWRRSFSLTHEGQSADVHVRLVPSQAFQDRQVIAPMNAGAPLKDSPLVWNSIEYRGWCFQERILSRAMLHFTQQEVMFEAHGRIENCQCGFHPYYMFRSIDDRSYSRSDKQWYNARPDGCGFLWDSLPSLGAPWHWERIVQMYSQRVLTHTSDLLPALAGVAQRFQEKFSSVGAQYVAGLWDFPSAHYGLEIWLCWYSDSWPESDGAHCNLCQLYPERGGLNPLAAAGHTSSTRHIPQFSWASRLGPCQSARSRYLAKVGGPYLHECLDRSRTRSIQFTPLE